MFVHVLNFIALLQLLHLLLTLSSFQMFDCSSILMMPSINSAGHRFNIPANSLSWKKNPAVHPYSPLLSWQTLLCCRVSAWTDKMEALIYRQRQDAVSRLDLLRDSSSQIDRDLISSAQCYDSPSIHQTGNWVPDNETIAFITTVRTSVTSSRGMMRNAFPWSALADRRLICSISTSEIA